MFQRVSISLGEIPSFAFGFLYILSILIFAIIYNNYNYYEFYHSTSKYEYELRQDGKRISMELLKTFEEDLRENEQAGFLPEGIKVTLEGIDQVTINEKNTIQFKILYKEEYPETDSTAKCLYQFQQGFSIFPHYPVRTDTFPGNQQFSIVQFEFDSSYSNFEFQIMQMNRVGTKPTTFWDLFPLKNYRDKSKPIISAYRDTNTMIFPGVGFVRMSKKLNEEIKSYYSAMVGFPNYSSSGNFERMFYLSSITITTVGFGDVVPISQRARITVAIEAIWGIILIGLFLNSLAYRIYAKK